MENNAQRGPDGRYLENNGEGRKPRKTQQRAIALSIWRKFLPHEGERAIQTIVDLMGYKNKAIALKAADLFIKYSCIYNREDAESESESVNLFDLTTEQIKAVRDKAEMMLNHRKEKDSGH